jgi:hypothetical protein
MDKNTISEVMRAMGSRGGKVGGRKRMDALSPEERTALAKKAVAAREAKRSKAGTPRSKKAAAKKKTTKVSKKPPVKRQKEAD